jgi:hypothetical protein
MSRWRPVEDGCLEEMMNAQEPQGGRWKSMMRRLMRRAVAFGRRVPPGPRTMLGLAFIVGGLFGFLPILGFWMLPLGLVLIMLDLRSLRRQGGRWKAGRSQSDDHRINTERRPASPPEVKGGADD